jgi:hypothetical protein
MGKDKTQKLRAQVKSRWYYIFWGAATVSVFAGQIYVGNGFKRMAESFDNLFNPKIELKLMKPMDPWEDTLPDMLAPMGPEQDSSEYY